MLSSDKHRLRAIHQQHELHMTLEDAHVCEALAMNRWGSKPICDDVQPLRERIWIGLMRRREGLNCRERPHKVVGHSRPVPPQLRFMHKKNASCSAPNCKSIAKSIRIYARFGTKWRNLKLRINEPMARRSRPQLPIGNDPCGRDMLRSVCEVQTAPSRPQVDEQRLQSDRQVAVQ